MLLITAYWRTNLTLRQLAPLFGVSKSAADRIIDHLGLSLALRPRRRFRKDTVLIVDGTLVPTRDHTLAEQPKNYRYSMRVGEDSAASRDPGEAPPSLRSDTCSPRVGVQNPRRLG